VKAAGERVRELRRLTADNASQQRRLDAIEPLIADKFTELTESIELRRQQGLEETRRAIATDKGKQAMDAIRRLVGEMQDEENARLATRSQEADAMARTANAVILYGTLVAFVVLSAGGWIIARNIARPLQHLTGVAERIAGGDVDVEVPATGRDDEVGVLTQAFARMCRALQSMAEVAKHVAAGDLTTQVQAQSEKDVLGQSFATMTASLRDVLRDIAEAVNVLAASSGEIMASTTQLASSATETATAVAQTTTTVEELKQTSQISSQKAKFVSDQAQKVVDISQGGKRSVDQTVAGMDEIRQQMGAVAGSILILSAQGQAIGEIIVTVDDLAAQSKLLAVNASIEAAKAGDAGRGFSVVAQEVRLLAEQSKQATTQVRGILNEIQKATSSAVLATEQAGKTVETAVRRSTAAGDSIGTLAVDVSEAAQAATQIAATNQQQSVGMDQVALAMENIQQASTQTVRSTRQAEATAQRLHELGRKLKQLVERFKV
jgi:methyl-accepting chemotaxis protein